ncbi:hypothetical protein BC834DRAFT_1045090 [Gloeopeniophorella convolvens]|nr:hypothetical protein BC834DRAFT_1045090 [Gloeopeniophorella convolvens]
MPSCSAYVFAGRRKQTEVRRALQSRASSFNSHCRRSKSESKGSRLGTGPAENRISVHNPIPVAGYSKLLLSLLVDFLRVNMPVSSAL